MGTLRKVLNELNLRSKSLDTKPGLRESRWN